MKQHFLTCCLKISAYQNFLNVIHGTIEETTIGSKIAMIYAALLNLEKIESQGGNASRIVFYTDLPTYDTEPLINALPHFLQSVENIKNKLNNTMSPNEQVIMANELKDAIAIIKPLAQNEFEHILELDKKLKQDIKHDKMLRNE